MANKAGTISSTRSKVFGFIGEVEEWIMLQFLKITENHRLLQLTRPGSLLSSVISLVSLGGISPSSASFSVGVSVVDVLSFFLRAKAHSLQGKGSALEV
jgi:hypothetical protein